MAVERVAQLALANGGVAAHVLAQLLAGGAGGAAWAAAGQEAREAGVAAFQVWQLGGKSLFVWRWERSILYRMPVGLLAMLLPPSSTRGFNHPSLPHVPPSPLPCRRGCARRWWACWL